MERLHNLTVLGLYHRQAVEQLEKVSVSAGVRVRWLLLDALEDAESGCGSHRRARNEVFPRLGKTRECAIAPEASEEPSSASREGGNQIRQLGSLGCQGRGTLPIAGAQSPRGPCSSRSRLPPFPSCLAASVGFVRLGLAQLDSYQNSSWGQALRF